MPMHDWSRVEPNIYHDFHQAWALELRSALRPLLPTGYTALVEQWTAGHVPDVVTVERRTRPRDLAGAAVLPPPQTRLSVQAGELGLWTRASRVAIRHRLGEVVCVIEIVSPGNKAGVRAVRAFLDKTVGFLRAGVSVLLVDPFPPTPRDPNTLHPLIWDELTGEDTPFAPPADEPLLLASYRPGDPVSGVLPAAYLEPFRVGAALRDMPAWLDGDFYVNVPLEAAYQAAWADSYDDVRHLVEHGRLPDE